MLSWDDYNEENAGAAQPATLGQQLAEPMPDIVIPEPAAEDRTVQAPAAKTAAAEQNPVIVEQPAERADVAEVPPLVAEVVVEVVAEAAAPTTQADVLAQAEAAVAELHAPMVDGDENQRVTVDQKRMINCRADLNQLRQSLDAAGSQHDRRYCAVEVR